MIALSPDSFGMFGNEPRDVAVMLLWASILVVGVAQNCAANAPGGDLDGDRDKVSYWLHSSSMLECATSNQGQRHLSFPRVPVSSESLLWWQVRTGGAVSSESLRMARLGLIGLQCSDVVEVPLVSAEIDCASLCMQVGGDECQARHADAKLVAALAKLCSSSHS